MKHLNDLSGKAWTKFSKTVWVLQSVLQYLRHEPLQWETSVMISAPASRDPLKKQHPATFVEEDIIKLIELFTQKGELVCDPFLGSGSSAIAAMTAKRNFVGIELYSKWLNLAKKRLASYLRNSDCHCELHEGNALSILKTFQPESIDFVITSPPYWNILSNIKKNPQKSKIRQEAGLLTDYGDHPDDMGRLDNYHDFLNQLEKYFEEYHRILKPKKYAAIIVSDFRKAQEYYLFHADVSERLKKVGFLIQGLIVLIQDNKKLFPYGYPTTFVPNITNQFVVIGRKV